MATDIVFKCPICKSHKIEEIMVDVTVVTEICELQEFSDGDTRYTSMNQTNEDGHVDRYQCGECGYTIVDHNSPLSIEGLALATLAKAIKALDDPPQKGDLVSHDELVGRMADHFATLSGEELANEWNERFDDPVHGQVVYEGDSLFRVKGT